MRTIIASAAVYFTAITLSLATLTGAVSAQTTGDVTAACSAGTNLPAPVCDCMGERSEAFSEQQREFMVAVLRGESDLANQLRTGMSVADLVAVTNFIGNSPLECLQGG
ncbi:MAG: hypothetical protein RLO50_23635 [Azospirillaceae bacterium]